MAVATNALTTLTTVKDDLGISVTTYDSQLERLINAASDAIQKLVGRKLYYEVDIEERKRGYGLTIMTVDRTPIVSIDSITYDGSTVSSDDYLIVDANAGWIQREIGWLWTARLWPGASQGVAAGTEIYDYVITYTGGWVTPQQAADDGTLTRNLPYDLEDACIETVRAYWFSKKRDPTITAESIGKWSTKYGSTKDMTSITLGNLPASAQATALQYQRISGGAA